MTIAYFIPPVSAFLLLAAHFYRANNYLFMLLSVLMIFVMFVGRPWAARTLQISLLLGSVEWLRTTLFLVMARSETGAPFLRLAIILGAVSLVTALTSVESGRTSSLRLVPHRKVTDRFEQLCFGQRAHAHPWPQKIDCQPSHDQRSCS
jgi:hypothetical protein